MRNDTWYRIVLLVILFMAFMLGLDDSKAQEDEVVWENLNEPIIKEEGTISYIEVQLVMLQSYDELNRVALSVGIDYEVEGLSDCDRDIEANIASCTIYVVEPVIVDGLNSWAIGHELLHGVFGPNYHGVPVTMPSVEDEHRPRLAE